ncbi:MAG: hypothetical protein WDM76_09530 [Limisphaerales bacterium]
MTAAEKIYDNSLDAPIDTNGVKGGVGFFTSLLGKAADVAANIFTAKQQAKADREIAQVTAQTEVASSTSKTVIIIGAIAGLGLLLLGVIILTRGKGK